MRMNAKLLRNVGSAFVLDLAWVAGIMYAASKVDPFNEYLAFAMYWILPLSAYLALLHRSGWMLRAHRALRLSIFGVIGFGLSLLAINTTVWAYSLALSHALNNL